MKRFLLASALLVGLSSCVADPTSPWEITVQFERSVPLLENQATIAVRAVEAEEPTVILNVRCENTDRTLTLPQHTVTPEICGLTFELMDLTLRGADPTAARFFVRWDDEEPGASAE